MHQRHKIYSRHEFAITLALMVGTAGLPHVIVRFFTVPKVSDARLSMDTAPVVHLRFCIRRLQRWPRLHAITWINTVSNSEYQNCPKWFGNWEKSRSFGLAQDKNQDGRIQYVAGAPFAGAPYLCPDTWDIW